MHFRFAPGETVGENVMIDLSNRSGEIAVLHEVLRQGHHVRRHRPHISFEVPYLQRIRPQSCHQAGPRRIANGRLAVGIVENDTHPGEPVDIWTNHMRGAIAAEFRSKVIDGDEQNIGLLFPNRSVRGGHQGRSRDDQGGFKEAGLHRVYFMKSKGIPKPD